MKSWIRRVLARRALWKMARPPARSSLPKPKKLSQELVDEMLHQRALSLKGAFTFQEQLRNRLRSLRGDNPQWERTRWALWFQEDIISSQKSLFWRIHELAGIAGFKVRVSWKDYLT